MTALTGAIILGMGLTQHAPFAAADKAGGKDAGAEAEVNRVAVWLVEQTGGGISRPRGTTCTSWTRATSADAERQATDLTWIIDGIRWRLYRRTCGTTTQWARVPELPDDVVDAILIDRLIEEILPDPKPATAPPNNTTFVTLGTWFWTDPAEWHDYTASISIPGRSITATATPTTLSFDPGDGEPAATCAGPGDIWQPADGDDTPSDCMYTYIHSSEITDDGIFHASLHIDWHVTVTRNNEPARDLTTLTTTTTLDIDVRELQAIIVANE